MAGNHGFADGNKRTTLILLHTLIQNSGYRLVPRPVENIEMAVEEIILASASRAVTLEQLNEWFRLRLEKAE
jgi:death-on-curing protein